MKDRKRSKRSPFSLPVGRAVGLVISVAAFLLPYLVTFEGLSPAGHRVFSIFLMAIALWVTEAIPLHATAALIILLEILTVSDKALIAVPGDFSPPEFGSFYAALAHPVLMLFLGGFFLADGAAKFKLDRNMARILLRPFGTSPNLIMLGLMLITAAFSMFMSNTATTATMMAVVLPVIATLPKEDRMRTGLALCIPFAANIGGIGTPVGTPPNAIALGALADAGPEYAISFVKWMMLAVPGMIVVLAFSWFLLTRLFKSKASAISLSIDATFDRSPKAWIFYLTFIATIALWLTEPLHGIKSSIVGFVPVVILLGTGVFTHRDMQSIQWHVLWLVAGGIALGKGVSTSGLDEWLIGLVSWEAMGPAVIGGVLCLVALVLSCVISNSATANLLVPIGMSLAMSDAVDLDPLMTAVFIAIGASLAMALPISTPPNAIAYSTGTVQTKQMALVGSLIGFGGWLVFVLVAPRLWAVMGLLPQ